MIEYFRLIFDSGLLILILIVQLIVYPSFMHYEQKNLLSWHSIYTKKIAFIVIPLMFGQLFVAIFQVYQKQIFDTVFYAVVVLTLWGITLMKFAPMHAKISNGDSDRRLLLKLVNLNWYRTFLWCVLFLFTLFKLCF